MPTARLRPQHPLEIRFLRSGVGLSVRAVAAVPSSLADLARARDVVLRRVTEGLAQDGRVVGAWLPGSFGRQEADEWSDLDLQVAVLDDELDGILRDPSQLLDIPAEPLLVQAGWPSTSFPGGRFGLAIYEGPVEIDWSIGPCTKAVREEASVLLFERNPIPTAEPPVGNVTSERQGRTTSDPLREQCVGLLLDVYSAAEVGDRGAHGAEECVETFLPEPKVIAECADEPAPRGGAERATAGVGAQIR